MAERKTDLKVVLDANILVSGSVWPRWPYEVLLHAANGDFDVVLSPYIISQAYATLSKKFVSALIHLDAFFELPNIQIIRDPTKKQVEKAEGLVRDKTDIPVALVAIKSKADYLVSEDKDLTAQNETTAELRKQITVMLSGTFLREVMGWNSDDLERVRGRIWKDLESLQD